MCGIAGIISSEPLSSHHRDIASRMQSSLIHRGPDDEGAFHESHLVLTHRRLSIIDLERGKQPLYSHNRSVVLVINGEIYNYIELRRQLKKEGCHFATNSDCEVIIYLYEKYGVECLRHLRGMFAFALWDDKRRRLFLARDRMGEKPLYLYQQGETLFFSSEMKSLLKSKVVPFLLDPEAVHDYFYYQYVPEPKTLIKGVRKLAAGHYLTMDADSGLIEEKEYWNLKDAPPLEGNPAVLIRDELERVSEIVIRSDVPVGVALSGGLDSSSICILAARKYRQSLHAFSVGYPGRPPSDERRDAKILADQLRIPFHEIEIGTPEMIDFFPELISWMDDPLAEISAHCQYAVTKLAREHSVPVVLQGLGGDELLWGYPWVRNSVRFSQLKNDGNHFSAFLYSLGAGLRFPESRSFKELIRWALSLGGLKESWRYFSLLGKLPKERLVFYDLSPDYWMAMNNIHKFYQPDFYKRSKDSDPSRLFNLPRPWKELDIEITSLICKTFLLNNCLILSDRLSMASSIESRLPLLDYKLIETIIGLRKTHKDFSLAPKSWLKSALKDILPDYVLSRPKKGFSPPTLEWIRQLMVKYGNLLPGGYLSKAGVLTDEAAENLKAMPFPRGYGAAPLSYKALVLEMWCRKAEALTV